MQQDFRHQDHASARGALSSGEPAAPLSTATQEFSTSRRPASWLIWLAVGALLALFVQTVVPVPYVVERPGPVIDTLGEVPIEGQSVPLIQVPEGSERETGGELNLLTVSVVGSPERSIGWFGLVPALFNPAQRIVPMESVFPEGQTGEERQAQNEQLMVSSQTTAIVAALRALGEEVPATVVVQAAAEGSPAEGVLGEGDILRSINGTPVTGYEQLRRLIAATGTGSAVTVAFEREGEELVAELTPVLNAPGGNPVVGIVASTDYEIPVEVALRIDSVGGPSAGLMFALGIYDTLTDGVLTGGKTVSGTGTIDSEGTVGAIGGLPQKMHGAARVGTELFLMPLANCAQVPESVPGDMTVATVGTMEEALAAVELFAKGEIPAGLERCNSATAQG